MRIKRISSPMNRTKFTRLISPLEGSYWKGRSPPRAAQAALVGGHLEGSTICMTPLMMCNKKAFYSMRNGRSNRVFSCKLVHATSLSMIFEFLEKILKNYFLLR